MAGRPGATTGHGAEGGRYCGGLCGREEGGGEELFNLFFFHVSTLLFTLIFGHICFVSMFFLLVLFCFCTVF